MAKKTVAKKPAPSADVTVLLGRWREGSAEAEEQLMVVVHAELRKLAASYLRKERAGHTLEPTDIVNEAYLRLIPQRSVHWENRSHFFGIAAQMMRRILVDHARKKQAAKREGFAGTPVTLSNVEDPNGGMDIDVLALHAALTKLTTIDPRQAKILEMRYFGGLQIDEIATIVGVAAATVKRDLVTGVAWLRHEMKSYDDRTN
jgi:RNA polymerase sigma factor (TIGR02999 family)